MKRQLRFLLPGLLFAVPLAACSGGTSTSGTVDLSSNVPTDAATGGDLATVASLDLSTSSAYPSGPYGNNVGDTLPPLDWQGYVNDHADSVATTQPFENYSMEALHRSGRAYALIHLAEVT